MANSDITEKEAQVLLKFRGNLTDLSLESDKSSDAYLIRWLRARDLNLKKAEDMLRAHLKWRKEANVDAILEWNAPELYARMYPSELCGHDIYGHPIAVCPTRFTDFDAFWQCDKDEYMRYCIQSMEKMLHFMKKSCTTDKPVCQCVILYDLDQFNIKPFFTNRQYMKLMQDQSKFFNENYPELIYKAYFLYSPRLFTVLWSVFKRIIPKRSVEKFKIYGHNPEDWLPELLTHIPKDQLPVRFGGSNEEFDKTAFQNCKLPETKSSLTEGGELIKASVQAGSQLKLSFKVEEPNSTLTWSFQTENHDIGFCIEFDGQELINHGRVEANKTKQAGLILCEKEGEYNVIFENSYSRMRSKTLYYKVELESPIFEECQE